MVTGKEGIKDVNGKMISTENVITMLVLAYFINF